MVISIRNPEVGELARELARLRKTNMTEAIASALHNGLEARKRQAAARERLEDLANETIAMASPIGVTMTKDEIDEFWGQ